MRKKLISITLAFVMIGYVGYNYFQSVQRETAKEREHQLQRERLKSAINESSVTHNALADWKTGLTREIFTSDLEARWLGQRPILFFGKIIDVAALDEYNYKVLISYDFISDEILTGDNLSPMSGLQLLLTASKTQVEPILHYRGEAARIGRHSRRTVAVIAKIEAIRSIALEDSVSYALTSEPRGYLGEGRLVELIDTSR